MVSTTDRELGTADVVPYGQADRFGLRAQEAWVGPKAEAPTGQPGVAAGGFAVSPVVAQAKELTKVYGEGTAEVHALDGVSVDFERGRLTAIMGPSGSGKSTLMHCMAALDRPTSGTVVIEGVSTTGMKDKQLTELRRRRLGFVFQSFNLVPTLTAGENITLPLDIARTSVDKAWFDHVVDTVGLRDRLSHRPSQLSGGQQQRVACARALVSRPAIVFADEPTGNLDSRSSADLLQFLRQCVDDLGQSIVMVTHDPKAAGYADRVLFLADGLIVDELLKPTADGVYERMRAFDRPQQGA
jgi:putative ABC transport system ATP-binding protein